MKRIISLIILALFMFTLCTPCVLAAEETTVIYVSPDGNDSALGSIESPLRTFDGARKRVREHLALGTEAIEVVFRGGDYYTRSVKFTEEDSGTPEHPIVYRAYEGETVNIKGSVPIVGTFTPVTDETILSKVRPNVRTRLVEIDLTQSGVTRSDLFNPTNIYSSYGINGTKIGDYNSVYINDVELDLAQWPNGRSYASWTGLANNYTLNYSEADPDRWVDAKNFWVKAYNNYDFGMTRASVTKVDPIANSIELKSTVTLTNPYSKRWKAFNLLEELDMPGEYYVDHDTMKLYMYAPHTLNGAKVEFSVEREDLVTLNKTQNVTFRNLNFMNTAGAAVNALDTRNFDVLYCSFKNIATDALLLWGNEKAISGANYWQSANMRNNASYDSDIIGNDFDNLGSTAMRILGGDVDTLTPSRNIVEDNFVTRCNMRYLINGAFTISGCGVTARNNIVSKSIQHGLNIAGNNHLVQDNEFTDVLREVADAGVIYAGRNQMMRGSLTTRNLLHNVTPKDPLLVSGTCGIYWDDGFQGMTATHNILVGISNGHNSNQGAANIYNHNTMVDCGRSWTFHQNNSRLDDDTFDHSMMGTIEDMVNDIADKELYFETYPDLEDWYITKKVPYAYSEVCDNLLVGNENTAIGTAMLKWATIEGNIELDATDDFVDPENLDYRLKSGSELAKLLPEHLNEDNYDIEQNGVINDRIFTTETQPFRLLYPENGSTVAPINVELFWQDVGPANEYRLQLAKDPEFTDLVFDDIVYFNNQKFDSLENGTRYYWRVYGRNTTRDLKAEWAHDGAVHTFVTGSYSILDTAGIESALDGVQEKLVNAVEGTTPGTYKAGVVDGLKNYIALTQKLMLLRTGRYSQSALDVRTEYINKYFDSKSILNRGYVDLFDFAERRFWKDNVNRVSEEEIVLETIGKFTGTAGLGYMSGNVIYCFDVEIHFNETAPSFHCIGLNMDNTSQYFAPANRGYFLCIKPDLIELQRTTGSTSEIVGTVPYAIDDGNKHSVKWGTLNTAVGNTVYAEIDGEVIYNYVDIDTTAPTDRQLEFGLNIYKGEGDYIKLYPSENVPSAEDFDAFVEEQEKLVARAVAQAFPEGFDSPVSIKDKGQSVLTANGVVDLSYAVPELVSENMMIPAKSLKALMDIDVTVTDETAVLTKDGITLTFTNGQGTYTNNGASVKAGYAPYLKNGHLMISAMDVVFALGYIYTNDWLNNMIVIDKHGAFNVVNDAVFLSNVAKVIDKAPEYSGGKDILFQ